MKSKGGRVSRDSNRTGENKDEERESKRGFGIANTKVCQRRSEILRTGKLLLLVYRRVCKDGKAIT